MKKPNAIVLDTNRLLTEIQCYLDGAGLLAAPDCVFCVLNGFVDHFLFGRIGLYRSTGQLKKVGRHHKFTDSNLH